MSYVIGNWTVAPQTVDTISSTKNLPIPDLDYAHDYTVGQSKSDEVLLINSTGASLRPAEKIKYSRRRVANVYESGLNSQLDICGANRANCVEGVHGSAELAYLLKATNSVSGEEVVLPMRAVIAFTVPTADFVSGAALTDLLKRSISTMFATGAVTGSQAIAIARGDLDPTV